LTKQIEEAVGQVLCSTGIGARVLDRDHLLLIARRLNERSAREKGLGQLILAEALCQRALDILETTVPPDHPQWVEVLDNGASILHQRAALLEARAGAIRASKADERFFGSREAVSRIEKRGEWGGVY
jgi:hypothetical protein